MNKPHKEEYQLKFHEPSPKDPCICGSGILFSSCCKGKYSSASAKSFRIESINKNYRKALVYARQHFTWYALAHKAHTVQLLKINPVKGLEFLDIDIAALSEILENIHWCYFRLKKSGEFPAVLRRVRNVIKNKRWSEKILYSEGLWHLCDQEDPKSTMACLKSIDIESCIDPDILTLYIHAHSGPISLLALLPMADKIINYSESPSVKLQYRCLKAMSLLCYDHREDAKAENLKGISEYEELPPEERTTRGKLQLCYALDLATKTTGDSDYGKQAIGVLLELESDALANNHGKWHLAEIYKLLADQYQDRNSHKTAAYYYKKSVEIMDDELTKVFQARSVLIHAGPAEAREILTSINSDKLKDSGRFDAAISWANLATKTKSISDRDTAIQMLKRATSEYPIFNELKSSLIIELMELKPDSPDSYTQKILLFINNYFELKPNLFGMGLNLNRIIENTSKSDGVHSDQQHQLK